MYFDDKNVLHLEDEEGGHIEDHSFTPAACGFMIAILLMISFYIDLSAYLDGFALNESTKLILFISIGLCHFVLTFLSVYFYAVLYLDFGFKDMDHTLLAVLSTLPFVNIAALLFFYFKVRIYKNVYSVYSLVFILNFIRV